MVEEVRPVMLNREELAAAMKATMEEIIAARTGNQPSIAELFEAALDAVAMAIVHERTQQ